MFFRRYVTMPRKKKEDIEDAESSDVTETAVGQEGSEEVEETPTAVSESAEGAQEVREEDYLPTRKVIRRKKSKREKEHPLASAIRLAVETGKVEFGSRSALKSSINSQAKLFIFARNTPAEVREQVTAYSRKSNVPVIEFDGNVLELGSVCGRPYSVSVLSVFDVGSSTLMSLVEKPKK